MTQEVPFDWSGGDPGVPFTVERPPLAPMHLLPQLGHEHILYSTANLPPGEWLRLRKHHRNIGASHVAGIMQRHPYATPISVAAEIKGLADTAFGPEELFRIDIGTRCEGQIRRLAANALQVPILQPGKLWPRYLAQWPQVLRHPRLEMFTCNLDGVVRLDDEWLPIECKWSSWRNRAAWRALIDTMDVSATIGTSVFAYYLQVQSQLSITGLRRGILIGVIGEDAAARMLLNIVDKRDGDDSFDPKPFDVVVVTIERDEETIRSIESVVPRFYRQFILGDKLPPVTDPGDLDKLRDAFRLANPPLPVLERPDLDDVCRKYKGITAELTRGKKLRDKRAAEILHALAEARVEHVTTGGHRVTYKENVNKVRTLRVTQIDGD